MCKKKEKEKKEEGISWTDLYFYPTLVIVIIKLISFIFEKK